MSINGFTAFVTASATADVMIFFRCTSAFAIIYSYILGTIDSKTGSFRSVDLIKSSNTTLRQDNANLRSDAIHLSEQIEELEQYGRRTSLRFHNVPIRDIDKEPTIS
jgi:hypothetical protein